MSRVLNSVAGDNRPQHIVIVAAENAAIPGGKVGGMADVTGSLPPALAALDCRVSVIVPSHGVLHRALPHQHVTQVETRFRNRQLNIDVYALESANPNVRQWALHHDDLALEPAGRLYAADSPSMPFATDASRFALFSRAAVNFIARELTPGADVIHCHDWHTGFVAILREFDTASGIADIPLVFSIHNLAYQGIRPFDHDPSSLSAWYPDIGYDGMVIGDPRWPECVNPMLAGIRLSDRIHVVSPTYAEEILQPSDVTNRGFHGGEGLESALQQANAQGKIVGILNGCDYPQSSTSRVGWNTLAEHMHSLSQSWRDTHPAEAHFIMRERIARWRARAPRIVVTAVTRLVPQKMAIALTKITDPAGDGAVDRTALACILRLLQDQGVCILLGSGDAQMERDLHEIAARHDNFIFLNGFSPNMADDLYDAGDLFLMPSSFEPCGLSQMYAMRAGQPCLVHAVGGLKDTVIHDVTGFSFNGDSVTSQAQAFVDTATYALSMLQDDAAKYDAIRSKARAARFLWSDTAKAYLDALYSHDLAKRTRAT